MPRYIDVSKYIEYLSELMESAKKHNKFDEAAELQREINRINNFTTADVAPVVHREWIHGIEDLDFAEYECSNCSFFFEIDKLGDSIDTFKYCPNCGAKMDGGKNDEM